MATWVEISAGWNRGFCSTKARGLEGSITPQSFEVVKINTRNSTAQPNSTAHPKSNVGYCSLLFTATRSSSVPPHVTQPCALYPLLFDCSIASSCCLKQLRQQQCPVPAAAWQSWGNTDFPRYPCHHGTSYSALTWPPTGPSSAQQQIAFAFGGRFSTATRPLRADLHPYVCQECFHVDPGVHRHNARWAAC